MDADADPKSGSTSLDGGKGDQKLTWQARMNSLNLVLSTQESLGGKEWLYNMIGYGFCTGTYTNGEEKFISEPAAQVPIKLKRYRTGNVFDSINCQLLTE